jgi:hypothetical protein
MYDSNTVPDLPKLDEQTLHPKGRSSSSSFSFFIPDLPKFSSCNN